MMICDRSGRLDSNKLQYLPNDCLDESKHRNLIEKFVLPKKMKSLSEGRMETKN